MSSPWTRRALLAASGAGTVTLLAGCSGSDGGGGGSPTPTATPDPDLGRDSYGLRIRNEGVIELPVTVTVTQPFGDETAFDRKVTMPPESSREWNQVITGEKEWAVKAEIHDVDPPNRPTSDSLWITPGQEDSPDVENVEVVMVHDEDMEQTKLFVTHDEYEEDSS